MVHAYILVQTEVGKAAEVAGYISKIAATHPTKFIPHRCCALPISHFSPMWMNWPLAVRTFILKQTLMTLT